jgi:hypothetical protein
MPEVKILYEITAAHFRPKVQDHANCIDDYTRDLKLAKWGLGVSMHSSIF